MWPPYGQHTDVFTFKKNKKKELKWCWGEGADEILLAISYFHQAPNDVEFHRECVKRLNDLRILIVCEPTNQRGIEYGCRSWRDFIETHYVLIPKLSSKMVLKSMFFVMRSPPTIIFPKVLWRQKEQFSDGVGYSGLIQSRVLRSIIVGRSTKIWPLRNLIIMIFIPVYLVRTTTTFVRRWSQNSVGWRLLRPFTGRAQKTHIDKKE